MITLLHGSSIVVDHPLVNVGRRELDFGPGFYVTRFEEQARNWAKRVSALRQSQHGWLSRYTFDDVACRSDCRTLVLERYDRQWFEFVAACRSGKGAWEQYDVIEGGVANDQVIDTVEDYFSGRITVEQALGQLKWASPTHQMCILRQEVISNYLKFETSQSI